MYQKPTNKDFQKIFDKAALEYDQITNDYAVFRRKEFFLRWANGKCLEVGAGTGEISKALSKKHTIIATDISPQMVKSIKAKLNIEAVACDAEKLPFPNNYFDTVISAEMIYYLDHPEKFIKEASRVLKPGGRLLISSASTKAQIYDQIRSFLRKLGFGSMYFDDQNREFMSVNKLSRLLDKGGFKILEQKNTLVLPFKFLDKLNRILEITPLSHFGAFILVYSQKEGK